MELHVTLREEGMQEKVQSPVVRPWSCLLTHPTHGLENGQTQLPVPHFWDQPFPTFTFKNNYQYFQPLVKIILVSQTLPLNFLLDHSGAWIMVFPITIQELSLTNSYWTASRLTSLSKQLLSQMAAQLQCCMNTAGTDRLKIVWLLSCSLKSEQTQPLQTITGFIQNQHRNPCGTCRQLWAWSARALPRSLWHHQQSSSNTSAGRKSRKRLCSAACWE